MTEPAGGWTFRDGRTRRFGILFAAVWLVFLIDPVREGWRLATAGSAAGVVGLVAVAAFAACYLAAFSWIRGRRQRMVLTVPAGAAALVLAVLLGLALVVTLAVGQAGTACLVYVVVVGVMILPGRAAAGLVVVMAAGNEVLARVVPGWTEQAGLTFAICTAAFAMWGVQQLMLRNVDLIAAQEENARLAIEEERNRFARDLHDILGHSLTVITVKAELANRLIDLDPERARNEVAELERLSRDALVDVRRAVQGYREITLPGELARAREALRTAGIEAHLPNSTDDVESDLRDLFAWAVREGVTNAVRHSGARSCTVTLGPRSMAVRDDGRGPDPGAGGGHGLAGLRERAAKAGATVVTRTLDPHGFLLEVHAR